MTSGAVLAVLPAEYRRRAQTFVKHAVLRNYLDRAAMTILSKWDDFVFIDGFSGPWQNAREDCSDTSFGIAIARLREARANWDVHGRKRKVRCVFVEKRESAYRRLRKAASAVGDIECTTLHGMFEEHIDSILTIAGRSAFTLTFVDPTGWSFDLRRLAPLLQRRPGEVLVNFMYEHFRRFIEDRRPEIKASQDRAFGGGQWRDRLAALLKMGLSREDAILEVFKHQLRKVCGFDFVASARIRHPLKSQTHFYLVYGTRSFKGLVEFRKAERDALRCEEFVRTQARDQAKEDRTGQAPLFDALVVQTGNATADPRIDDREGIIKWLPRALSQHSLDYEKLATTALQRFSVTETELKDILVSLQARGNICFRGMAPRQRKPDKGVKIANAVAA